MNYESLLLGLFTFLIIGLFHPIVIKGEYYFGIKIWPIFAVFGVIFIMLGLLSKSLFHGGLLSVTGFSCLWSIKEIFEQEERVKKGWFPSNPKRNYKMREERGRVYER